jgi:hypothetical protein
MYYEHQYDRIGKQEESQLTITNYVLTMSALAFTFGYQNVVQLTIINGIALPLLIIIVNIFAIGYINRAMVFINLHQSRAWEILKRYAPELKEINDRIQLNDKKIFLGGRRRLQRGIHLLLIVTAFIPATIYFFQIF